MGPCLFLMAFKRAYEDSELGSLTKGHRIYFGVTYRLLGVGLV